jgi:hypothetical protein
MARKQLIKGANAVRVEERISRVPDEPSIERSIFGALKEMESSEARSAPAAAERAPRPVASKARALRPVARPVTKPTAGPAMKTAVKPSAEPAVKPTAARPPKSVAAPKAVAPAPPPKSPDPGSAQRRKLRTSDFTAAERREILNCCVDYRNRLPIYLLSARREVELLDSIIGKCGGGE